MTDDQSLDEASTMKENRTSEEISADKHYKNAFHVFRALCKLSDREMKDKGNVDPKYFLNVFFFFEKKKTTNENFLRIV